MPLASLGSGVEQVVLHAVAATSVSNSVVTFEEPELHLHPILQRQLLSYLARTDNQYFISTHSAHIIDSIHANAFHVRLNSGESTIEFANNDAGRHRICFELGYKASDLVQSNCIIWVEGPSDRIYIRGWLSQFDAHLQENVHYSIMFYGGKLLSHLSAAESSISDFSLSSLIQLRLLNRHMAVIMDSDLSSSNQTVRQAKTRVQDEIVACGGIAWITAGREIENYVRAEILASAVESVAPGRGGAIKKGRFAKALPVANDKSKITVDKLKTATKVLEYPADLDVFDLRVRLLELSKFIRKSNGLSTTDQ